MNSLAKAYGIVGIAAAVVVFMAIVIGIVNEDLSVGTDSFEAFAANSNVAQIFAIAGALMIVTGAFAFADGARTRRSWASVYGFLLIAGGLLFAIALYESEPALKWDDLVLYLAIVFAAVAIAAVAVQIADRCYILASVDIIMAAFVALAYILKDEVIEGMLLPIAIAVSLLVINILAIVAIPCKAKLAEEEKKAAEEAAAKAAAEKAEADKKAAERQAQIEKEYAEKKAAKAQAKADEQAKKDAAAKAAAEKKAAPAAEAKPAAEKPAEAKPVAAPAAEAKTAETKPVEAAPAKKEEPAPAAVAAAAAAPAAIAADEDISGDDDLTLQDLGIEEDTPITFVRRASWNKGLRCRRDYGEKKIPVAFVKGRVAVYVDGAVPDHSNDAALADEGWTVLHFKEADVTDGEAEAVQIAAAVKENLRADKAAKAKAAKKKAAAKAKKN
ncbi:hypothetical protein TALC_00190 [Thermoplasmatales archaeon BRNA1]|nr:hypothetical protein TALC_00190 [Thermoplasmatales archaeon BRNA1]